MKIRYRRVIKTIKDDLTDEEAKALIVEARINDPGELDVYETCGDPAGCIQRVFTIPISYRIGKTLDSDGLLEYARNNMPNDIVFGF